MLKINHIFKSYFTGEKRQDVLKDVSFSLPEKGLFFIVGKSGSGKSTLLNLIGGLDRPDQGSILIDGKDIVKMKEKELSAYRARKIGFVFQEYNLLSGMTVEENLLLATDRKVEDKEIDDLLSKAGLLSFKKKKVELLSGGEKQRVALVRAMLKDCRIILSDEPTGSLDSENAENVFSLLKEVSKDRLVLVVTHDRESAEKYKDGIVEIKDGKVTDTLPAFEERNIPYKEEKELKLSFRKRIRLAFSLMRKRPARMIVMLLISIFSFSLFGISDSMSSFDVNRSVLKSMKQDNFSSIEISKSYHSESLSFNTKYGMNDEDIKNIDAITKGSCLPIHSFAKGWHINNTKNTSFIDGISVSDSNYPYYVTGSIIATQNILDTFHYSLTGRLPEKTNEIIISDYFADMYRRFDFVNKDKVKSSIEKNEDLIGKEAYFTNINRNYGFLPKTYTIVGVINTNYDVRKYSVIFQDDPKYDSSIEYDITKQLVEDIKSNLYSVIGFSKEFFDTFKPEQLADDYITFSDYQVYMSFNCYDIIDPVYGKVYSISPFDVLKDDEYVLKSPYRSLEELPDNAVILEKDYFTETFRDPYHEKDFLSFSLESTGLGINEKVIIAGYTSENYLPKRSSYYVAKPMFSKISQAMKPLMTNYSHALFITSDKIGQDTKTLNKILKANPGNLKAHLLGKEATDWISYYEVHNPYYADIETYSYGLKSIAGIVTLVTLIGIIVSALFFLFSILDILNRSLKKIGILYAQGYSFLSISLTYLVIEIFFMLVISVFSFVLSSLVVSLANKFFVEKLVLTHFIFGFSIRQVLLIIAALIISAIIGFVPTLMKIKKAPIIDILSDRK